MPQDGPPAQGLALAEARRRLGAIVDGFLVEQERQRSRRRRPPRSFADLLKEGVLPPLLALVLLALGRLLSPGSRTEDGEWFPFWTSLGALGGCVVLNAWLVGAQQAAGNEEVVVRLRRALRRYRRQWEAAAAAEATVDDAGAGSWRVLCQQQGPRSHVEESYLVYRSGWWVRLPALLLVEDDVVALAAGDEAPATVQELGGLGATLRHGTRVEFRAEAHADFRCRSALEADSVKLLRLCGDLRCFRVVEAPLRAFLHKTVGVAADDEEALSPSLFAKDMAEVDSAAVLGMLVLIAALIVLAALRFTWQERERRDGAFADYIFTEPSRLALLALPVSRPLLVLLVEALGTARLLVVLEALERGSGRAPSQDPATRPELDVEQRLSLRSAAPLVSRRRFLKYTAAVLRARLMGGLAPDSPVGRQGPHVVLEMANLGAIPGDENDDEEEGDEEEQAQRLTTERADERVRKVRAGPLLPIPMNRSGVLQRLGGVTFLSVVNDELVTRDAPIPEEVLFLNAKKDQGEAVSATVLRLAPDASSPSALKFEHTQWVKHMAQLKPIGLNCLVVSPPQQAPGPATNSLDAEVALVAHALQSRRGRALRGVGEEVGFCEADLAPFSELLQVHAFSPPLTWAPVDVRAQSPEERRGRGGLQPHLTGVVLEDGRHPGGMLQLLSQGAPSVVLPWCQEYFDGAMLSRLTPEARALILETYCRRWALDDFNITALAYTPVPAALRGQLRTRGVLAGPVATTSPIYLADGLSQQKQKHGRLDAIQEQSMLESAARLAEQLRAEERRARPGSECDLVSEPRSASSGGTETPRSSSVASTPRVAARHKHQQQRRRHDPVPQQQQQQQQSQRSPHLSLLGAHLSMSMPDLNRASTVPPTSTTAVATATVGVLTPTRARVHSARREAVAHPPLLVSSDDLLTSRSLRSYARASLHSQDHGALWSLLQRQVFLGLVATTVQPTREAPPLVEELMAAGVRFTLFSPRTMRRTKALAESLGLQMDWNCALSLRPLDSADSYDPHRLISDYGDVVRNARLPYGIAAIREHVEQVDNVPLLVSIFTDATPDTAGEMVGIFCEYHESVLCVGHAWRASNGPIFRRADVAVAVVEEDDDSGSPASAAADRRFAAELVGLPCAFRLGPCPTGAGRGLAPLMDLIQEGRRLLACLYQMVALAVIVLTTAALMILAPRAIIPFPVLPTFSLADVLWLVWVVVPLLVLPILWTPADLAVATRCARKDGEVAAPRRVRENRRLILQYLALRCLPTVMACVYVQCRGAADLLLDVPDVLAACGLPANARWRILQCPSIPRADIGGQSLASITMAKDLTLMAFVWAAVVHSAGFLYRTASLGRESPFRNPVWPWTSLLLLLLQAAHLVFRAAARVDGLANLAAMDWDVWTMMALGPMGALIIGEGMAKPLDMVAANRAARFRRLAFDTRLGTHSPK